MDSLLPSSDSQLSLRCSAGELSTAVASASEKAWHLLALLISHGWPADPTELASKCLLFDSDPDFIRFLCSIPNSPIRLVQDCVTFSQTGFAAMAQLFAGFDVVVTVSDSPPRFALENSINKTCIRKRKRQASEIEDFSESKRCSISEICDEKELETRRFMPSDGFQNCFAGMLAVYMSGRYKTNLSYSPGLGIDFRKLERAILSPSLSVIPASRQQDHESRVVHYGYNAMENTLLRCHLRQASKDISSNLLGDIPEEKLTESAFHTELSILHSTTKSEVSKDDNVDFVTDINHGTSPWLGVDQNVTLLQSTNATTGQACGSVAGDLKEDSDEVLVDDSNRWDVKGRPMDGSILDKFVDKAVKLSSLANNEVQYVDSTRTEVDQHCKGGILKDQIKSSSLKVDTKNSIRHEMKNQGLNNCMRVDTPTELEQYKRNQDPCPIKDRPKRNSAHNINTRVKKETAMDNGKGTPSVSVKCPSVSVKNKTENRPLPDFDSFLVEKEEGSGGYGTVYRARRKSDGIIFAIKCPHVKANKNHVLNELKTLQRVGGKNYVIKYEGSFKSGDSDCLILEHVKHDKPEVLKREIDIFQLQWYGYCMLRALAGLHKLGIVHRDVKPGNFLFSRTFKRGFLIDFNLALDLHKNQGSCDNPGAGYNPSLSQTKSLPPVKDRKLVKTRVSEAMNNNAEKYLKSPFPTGSLKKVNQVKVYAESGRRSINKSQGGDGSGITSAKDVSVTKTPAERLRQPTLYTPRKELMNWAQEALHGGQRPEPVNAPTSKRKRVAAPQTTERKCLYPTPMPLHASGVAIHGAGLLKSSGKHKREGPCVGTKGFRAPEVLFKSVHQGPKVDVWSAGVTLLYLMIGRTPFAGEPEQNIKEIAKLRGSEDLWEVAKLHNQESLFPTELFDVKYLSAVKLRDWCAENTRRPDFLNVIPRSLFDLVDKCLTVNPRTRISAEDALRHEFFAPCHDFMRKQRLQRQASSPNSGTTPLLHGVSVM